MLIDFDKGGQIITAVPFQKKYQHWLRLLAARVHPRAIDSIKQWIHAELENKIVTTSWLPGADWEGTPYYAIYDALHDPAESAKFFGLICCDCVLERCAITQETWGYGHYYKDGIPIRGRTYFECPGGSQTMDVDKHARWLGWAVVLALLLLPTLALAQQQTIYGPDGRVQSRITTGSNGAVTVYGPDGRVTGRATTGSNGTTTLYGAGGARTGTITGGRR